MNRNFISVFVLLATLSMFNADDYFGPCTNIRAGSFPLLNVKMSGGELAKFDISGTISHDITTSTQVLIAYFSLKGAYYYKACGEEGKPSCPVPSGTQFSITIDNVSAPSDYFGILVSIGDDPEYNPYGCAFDFATPTFESCGSDKVPLNVAVSPNPPPPGLTKYDINGTLSNDITEKTQLIISYDVDHTYTYKACGDGGKPNCPVPSGTPFSMTADSVPVPDKIGQISVVIGDPAADGDNNNINTFGCAIELLG